jgi:hypothetical protein
MGAGWTVIETDCSYFFSSINRTNGFEKKPEPDKITAAE